MGTIACCGPGSELTDEDQLMFEQNMQKRNKQRLTKGIIVEVKEKFSEGTATFRKGIKLEVKDVFRSRGHVKGIDVNTLNGLWEYNVTIMWQNFKHLMVIERKHLKARIDGGIEVHRASSTPEPEQQVINVYNRKKFKERKKADFPDDPEFKEKKSTWAALGGWAKKVSNAITDPKGKNLRSMERIRSRATYVDHDSMIAISGHQKPSSPDSDTEDQEEEGPSFSQDYPDWFKTVSFLTQPDPETLDGGGTWMEPLDDPGMDFLDIEMPSDMSEREDIESQNERARRASSRTKTRVRVDRSWDDGRNAKHEAKDDQKITRTKAEVLDDLDRIARLIIYPDRDKEKFNSNFGRDCQRRAQLQNDLRTDLDFMEQTRTRAKSGSETPIVD